MEFPGAWDCIQISEFHFSCDVKGDLGKESKLGMCTQRMHEISFWQELQLSSSSSLFFPSVMLEKNSKVENSAFFSWISDVQDLFGCKMQREHITIGRSLLMIMRYYINSALSELRALSMQSAKFAKHLNAFPTFTVIQR